VNVSGLLCGSDILDQLRGMDVDLAILPRPSLDYFGERFLDGVTVEQMEAELAVPVGYASQWSEVVQMISAGPGAPGVGESPNGAFWSEPHHQLATAP
jgi:NifB/MoaA-like Fe-S oxidoreductase